MDGGKLDRAGDGRRYRWRISRMVVRQEGGEVDRLLTDVERAELAYGIGGMFCLIVFAAGLHLQKLAIRADNERLVRAFHNPGEAPPIIGVPDGD
jgi:hypothetical protein